MNYETKYKEYKTKYLELKQYGMGKNDNLANPFGKMDKDLNIFTEYTKYRQQYYGGDISKETLMYYNYNTEILYAHFYSAYIAELRRTITDYDIFLFSIGPENNMNHIYPNYIRNETDNNNKILTIIFSPFVSNGSDGMFKSVVQDIINQGFTQMDSGSTFNSIRFMKNNHVLIIFPLILHLTSIIYNITKNFIMEKLKNKKIICFNEFTSMWAVDTPEFFDLYNDVCNKGNVYLFKIGGPHEDFGYIMNKQKFNYKYLQQYNTEMEKNLDKIIDPIDKESYIRKNFSTFKITKN